ncbi:MAG: GNAT family N-acetyltransferase [Pseudonocardiales bacterium]|nr:GNAT family N-acetyltransferase [Pseudonocardiales bacterium]
MTLHGSSGPLHSPRLLLRNYTPDDLDAVLAVYADPVVTANFGLSPFTTETARAFLAYAVGSSGRHPRTEYLIAVVSRARRDIIGCGRLALDDHPNAEIGCVLRADHLNQGFGTEAVLLLLSLGFDHLRLHNIWGAIFPTNTLAASVAQKCGMTFEGILQNHSYIEGKWYDSAIYSILDHEWIGGVGRPKARPHGSAWIQSSRAANVECQPEQP